MTSTVPTALLGNKERAAAFAAAVRTNLSDLTLEELDDLLDGLDADLEERLADGGELGDATQYADELRQAAGLPQRDSARQAHVRPSAIQRIAALRVWIVGWFDETAPRRAIRDFADSLRPLWWILRAFVGAWVFFALTGNTQWHWGYWFAPVNGVTVLIAFALVIVSIQWGRGQWQPKRWIVWLRRAANALAALLVVPVLLWTTNGFSFPVLDDEDYSYAGLIHDGGEPIANIFAYDCTGKLLDGVQLFDEHGDPIVTLQTGDPAQVLLPKLGADGETGEVEGVMQRHPLALLSNGWNVYPLSQAAYDEDWNLGPIEASKVPYEEVPSLSEECATQDTQDDKADPDAG